MSYKILRFPLYLTIPNSEKYSEPKTGFGNSCWDISRYAAYRGHDVYCLPIKNTNSLDKIEDVKILPYESSFNLSFIFKNLKYSNILSKIREAVKYTRTKSGFSQKFRLFNNCLARSYFKKIISNIDPDVINVHGLRLRNIPQIDAGLKSKKPLLLTLHALGFSNRVSSKTKAEDKLEKKLLEYLNEKRVRISVISSRMRKKIIDNLNIKNPSLIEITPHGMDLSRFSIDESKKSLRKKYELDLSKNILFSAGTLCDRKNYEIAIKAISKLPSDVKDDILYLIAGRGENKKKLKKLIKANNLENTVKLLGYVSPDKIVEYFRLVDGVILCSVSECFGRPILEGYASGTPVIIFEDLEAVPDLYDPACMQLVKKRIPEDLSQGILKFLEKEWDEKFIKKYSQNFSWHNSLERYEEIYEKMTKSNHKERESIDLVQFVIDEY